ncbi:MAG: tRNA lysidine(34) synthetase TilS [Deltaproteobacteria bacterium]|jgi:tRNA(Ile)-lysidine synthase|nr:tRNA lysidine(34) synthetase TilS [Deltaproteobacteria bacterium]MBW2495991.1 tRNA lysidine(34) synthetase TilS [Deltaproteobacteria bacterium]
MLVEQTRERLESLEIGGGRMLVAASGGLDSTVLLALLRVLAAPLGLELVVGHVNHQLRGEASERDERWLEERSQEWGLAFHARRIDPQATRRGLPSRQRPTLEEACRDGRRQALGRLADELGCRWIATAHHADDQAETVLLRILRGTGPEGLAAMAPRSPDGRWLRPLLGVARAELEVWAKSHGLDWREDASNEDRRFARNRLRHDFLPQLKSAFNPQLLRALCDLAEAQRRDLEWIEALVETAAKERIEVGPAGIRVAIDGWEALPEALARRLARRVLIRAGLGRALSRRHLDRLLAFFRRGRMAGGDKELELPEGIRVRRSGDFFLVAPLGPAERIDPGGNATVLERD